MILRTETVDQVIDGAVRGTFVKDVVMTQGPEPLAMVRKRLPPPAVSRAAVLLVHGFGQNRYAWHGSKRSFSSYLAAAGYDVLNMELRGHGRSRRFGGTRASFFDEHVQEDLLLAADEAMQLAGHDRIFLLGHSMGGLVAYGAAATSLRGRVRGVISLGSPVRFGRGSATLFALTQLIGVLRAAGALDGNLPVPLRVLGRHFEKRRFFWDTRLLPMPLRAWLPGSIERDVLREYLHRAFDHTSLNVALAVLRSSGPGSLARGDGSFDYVAAFERIDVPLLVVAGTHDSLAPPASVRPAFELSSSRDKTYREFPLGHIDLIVGRQAPTTVWPLVRTWLDRR